MTQAEITWLAINIAVTSALGGYQICGLVCGITRTIKYRLAGLVLAAVVFGLNFVGRPDSYVASSSFWALTFLKGITLLAFVVMSFIPRKTAVTVK